MEAEEKPEREREKCTTKTRTEFLLTNDVWALQLTGRYGGPLGTNSAGYRDGLHGSTGPPAATQTPFTAEML